MPTQSRAELIQAFEQELLDTHRLIESSHGLPLAVCQTEPNAPALPIQGRTFRRNVRRRGKKNDIRLTESELDFIIANAEAEALSTGTVLPVFSRVAPSKGGVEIDIADEANSRIQIVPGNVRPVFSSDTLMSRNPSMRALPVAAPVGDFKLLRPYVNLSEGDWLLFVVWLVYTLCHPKIASTSYVILVLRGDQGSGKTFLCNAVIQALIDLGIGVQSFPSSKQDLAIAAMNAHLLMYDNVRYISAAMADLLCICATGGSLSSRRLYSDADQSVLNLHVALVLNTIHSCVTQPDLAQRCLSLYLQPLDNKARVSETELRARLQEDLPAIFSGLIHLSAKILKLLPEAKVTNPERMLDFCRWVAAFEAVQGHPPGSLQAEYSRNLKETLHDSLVENSLSVAVMRLAETETSWSGTPEKLLTEINHHYGFELSRSRDWPQNAIALSKRLRALSAGLRTQNIEVTFGRGKKRCINIISV